MHVTNNHFSGKFNNNWKGKFTNGKNIFLIAGLLWFLVFYVLNLTLWVQ